MRAGDADGLWDGFTGTGYMDMGGNAGDAVQFTVDAPSAGIYTLTFRYSNGGGGTNAPRPMSLSVNGTHQRRRRSSPAPASTAGTTGRPRA